MINNSYKIITDLSKLHYNKSCLITGRKFTEKDCKDRNVILLECNHAFLYSSFMLSYHSMNKHFMSYRKCPYCMCDISKITYKFKKTYRDYPTVNIINGLV